jgi:hypothetical protein
MSPSAAFRSIESPALAADRASMPLRRGASRIVCGVHDSAAARDATELAGQMALQFGLQLVIVHVARVDVPARLQIQGPQSVRLEPRRRRAERRGKRLLEALARASGLEQAELRVELGQAGDVLQALAEDPATAALVLGYGEADGRSSSGLLDELLAIQPCCIIVAPWGAGRVAAAPRGVLCGVGTGTERQEHAMVAAGVAEALATKLVAVHVVEASPAAPVLASEQRRARDLLIGVRHQLPDDLEVELRIELGDPRERLAAVAASIDAGMVVVGTSEAPRSGGQPDIVRGVLAVAGRPVLVVPSRPPTLERDARRV